MTIVTDTSSPGLPHTCKGWGEGGRGGGGTLRGARALWTKIQINICSCLGKNENDVLTIFIFYFYLAAGLTGLTSSIFSWQNDKIKTVRTDPDQGRCDYQVLSSFVWRLNNWPSKYRNVGYLGLVPDKMRYHEVGCQTLKHGARLLLIRSKDSLRLFLPDDLHMRSKTFSSFSFPT